MAKSERKRAVRSDKINFTSKQIGQVEALAGVGMTVEQIADYMGCSKSTMDRRIAEDEKLNEALRKGRTRAHGKVLQAAYNMATDEKHSDFTKFYLRSRYGWSEKQEIEISGDIGVNSEQAFLKKLQTMNVEELSDFVAQGRKYTGDADS